MARQPEGKFAKRCKEYLTKRGAVVFNIHGSPDNPFQEVGIPDLLVCYKGSFLGLELKQPGEEPSLKQKHTLKRIEEAGGFGGVITSLEQVMEILDKVDRIGGR